MRILRRAAHAAHSKKEESPPKTSDEILYLLVALGAVLVVHGSAIYTFFAQDDISFLSAAAGITRGNAAFRPISTGLLLDLQYRVFGLEPLGYHLVNLAVHLINVGLVYYLSRSVGLSLLTATSAAIVFGCSVVAFTPLHWISCIAELSACAFVLAATHVFLRSKSLWGASIAALLALSGMLCKETAIAWPIFAFGTQRLLRGVTGPARRLLPSVVTSIAFVIFMLTTGQFSLAGTDAYATSGAPLHLVANAATYVAWTFDLVHPIPDLVAVSQSRAWLVAVPLMMILGIAWTMAKGPTRSIALLGTFWWCSFLLPVIPLVSHTYLYYLYIPMAGASIAVVAIPTFLDNRLPHNWARTAVGIGLLAYAGICRHHIATRERLTRDYLPVDRTMRDAMLLENSLHDLKAARLPPGTEVGLVNPVPRQRFDLMTGKPTASSDVAERVSYYPLDAALRHGETIRLFLPGVRYRGFRTIIPEDWLLTEVFLPDQRGWLQSWGRGQRALERQAEVQIAAGDWAAAYSTLRRVRAMGDSLVTPLLQEIQTLRALNQTKAAEALADTLVQRWPSYDRSVREGPETSGRVRNTKRS